MVLEERKELLRSLELNLSKSKWVNHYDTNCYSYALGFDIPQYRILSYAPGMISGSPIKIFAKNYFTKSQLIYNIQSDLDILGIEYKKIDPSEKITSDKEWKIALYLHPLMIDFDDGEPLCYKVLGLYDKPSSLLLKEFTTPRESFATLINRPGVGRKGLWEENPFVFAYSFKLIK